ncbi:DUF892 family protein [Aquimarina sp. U1-2]|uniref:DUF892 family protein n=1 Tax=Aquimarina sp. U1-2 TaxID=2823141 RepID=UPI001AECD7D1|nr:DUF892 family protein [Aquimarina sp. U1-2]MBP2831071.1 DUF892 family protein [Aquimarina sp. U1-2]
MKTQLLEITTVKELYLTQVEDMSNGCEKSRSSIQKIKDKAQDKEVKEFVGIALSAMDKALEIFDGIFENHNRHFDNTQNKALTALGAEAEALVLEQDYEKSQLRDLAIISKLRNLIHYPIAGFETFITLAKHMGLEEDLSLLQKDGKSVISNDDAIKQMRDMEQRLLSELS